MGIFLMGFAVAGRAFCGFVWMTENMRVRDVSSATASVFTVDSLNLFFSSLYFMYISKSWFWLFAGPTIITCTLALWVIFFEDETPKFYYGRGQYDKTRKLLTMIGRYNGVLSPNQEWDGKFEIEYKKDSSSAEDSLSVHNFV
jgi:hypothetical protein